MQNTIWNAVAGSIFQMRRLDVLSNNIANANTDGFKADDMSFSAYLAQIRQRQFVGARRGIDSIDDQMRTFTSFAPGTLKTTGNPLDLAIAGDGFFTVQTPDGPQFTRSGNFRLDDQGTLVSGDGHPVLGEAGPVQLQVDVAMDLVFDEYGTVYQDGQEIGRLRVTDVANPETLQKAGGKRFKATPATRSQVMEAPQVQQGVLEGSNVNIVRDITRIVQVGRSFDAYQRVIGLVDNINQRATQQLAQVS